MIKTLKNIKLGVLLLIGMQLVACKQELPTDKAFAYLPETPVAGETVEIFYNANKTLLAGEEKLEGCVYFWQDYHWVGQDLVLKERKGVYTSEINIPKRASLVATKFMAGNKVDMGGPIPYVSFVFDSEGKEQASSRMGWALLRTPGHEIYSIPGYVPDSVKIEPDVFLYWCNQEATYFPEQRPTIFPYAAPALMQSDKEDKEQKLMANLWYALSQDSLGLVSEWDLYKSFEVGQRYLRDHPLTHLLEETLQQKYPKGILERDAAILNIFRTADPAAKAKAMEAFVKEYPWDSIQNTQTETLWLYHAKNFQSVIYNEIMQNDNYALLYQYIHELPFDYLTTYYRHIAEIPFDREMLAVEKVRPLAKLILQEIFTRERYESQLVYTPKEWEAYLASYAQGAIFSYAQILHAVGEDEEALQWAQKVYALYNSSWSAFTDLYIQLLQANGREAEVVPEIVKALQNNAVSPEMLALLKAHFEKENGTAEGFELYVQELKATEEQKAHFEALKASLIKEPIELFTLEDLEGNPVQMGQNGEILVLDFWATWCGPCKAAMPGMQMAVNAFKGDAAVAFYFISTMENTPDYKAQIEKFIADKQYNFTVLLDAENPANGKTDLVYSNYAKAFHFSGIPQKLIIDGQGNLRWRSTGYDGSPSALADEISYIIHLLKNEQTTNK